MNDCQYSEEIICPHCRHEHMDSYDFAPKEHEGGEVHCEDCGKEFYVQVSVEVSYTSSCIDHDFVEDASDEFPDCQKCSRCGEIKFTRFDNPKNQ